MQRRLIRVNGVEEGDLIYYYYLVAVYDFLQHVILLMSALACYMADRPSIIAVADVTKLKDHCCDSDYTCIICRFLTGIF